LNLKQWLEKNKKSVRGFAMENGIAPMTIYMHLWKTRRMSVRLAQKIQEITKGQVTAKEIVFYGE
jgi:hypothetical protein